MRLPIVLLSLIYLIAADLNDTFGRNMGVLRRATGNRPIPDAISHPRIASSDAGLDFNIVAIRFPRNDD